jgi:hypothetical protein
MLNDRLRSEIPYSFEVSSALNSSAACPVLKDVKDTEEFMILIHYPESFPSVVAW